MLFLLILQNIAWDLFVSCTEQNPDIEMPVCFLEHLNPNVIVKGHFFTASDSLFLNEQLNLEVSFTDH